MDIPRWSNKIGRTGSYMLKETGVVTTPHFSRPQFYEGCMRPTMWAIKTSGESICREISRKVLKLPQRNNSLESDVHL